jgi:CRISPR/Cas system endoribonuclease Cas6 (RAMP superfamily)
MRLEVELNADSELRLDLNYNHYINSLIYRF